MTSNDVSHPAIYVTIRYECEDKDLRLADDADEKTVSSFRIQRIAPDTLHAVRLHHATGNTMEYDSICSATKTLETAVAMALLNYEAAIKEAALQGAAP